MKKTAFHFARATLACLLLGTAIPSHGQVYDDISRYPTVKNAKDYPIDWAGFYRDAIAKTEATRRVLQHKLDLPYGADPKQKLDVYLPTKPAGGPAPVLIFLHGGGFAEGDRSIYGFLARPFAERGIVTVVASYRLTSGGFAFPAQSDDTRSIIAWVHAHISQYGGNPNSLFLSGHSAGALLVADAGADRSWMAREGIPASALRGVIVISDGYNLVQSKRYPAYAPTPLARYAASPVFHVRDPAPRFIIAAGGGEKKEVFIDPSIVFSEVLKSNGSECTLFFPGNMNHQEILNDFSNTNSDLFKTAVAEIIQAPLQEKAGQ